MPIFDTEIVTRRGEMPAPAERVRVPVARAANGRIAFGGGVAG